MSFNDVHLSCRTGEPCGVFAALRFVAKMSEKVLEAGLSVKARDGESPEAPLV